MSIKDDTEELINAPVEVLLSNVTMRFLSASVLEVVIKLGTCVERKLLLLCPA